MYKNHRGNWAHHTPRQTRSKSLYNGYAPLRSSANCLRRRARRRRARSHAIEVQKDASERRKDALRRQQGGSERDVSLFEVVQFGFVRRDHRRQNAAQGRQKRLPYVQLEEERDERVEERRRRRRRRVGVSRVPVDDRSTSGERRPFVSDSDSEGSQCRAFVS